MKIRVNFFHGNISCWCINLSDVFIIIIITGPRWKEKIKKKLSYFSNNEHMQKKTIHQKLHSGIALWPRILTRTFLLCYCVSIFYDLMSKKWLFKISVTNSEPECDPCAFYSFIHIFAPFQPPKKRFCMFIS